MVSGTIFSVDAQKGNVRTFASGTDGVGLTVLDQNGYACVAHLTLTEAGVVRDLLNVIIYEQEQASSK